MSDHDDFWGDTPDWTSETPRPRRSFGITQRRRAIVDRLSAGRRTEHHDVASADDAAPDDIELVPGRDPRDRDASGDHLRHDQGTVRPTRVAGTAHAELDVDIDSEPIDERHSRPTGGVDPLLARFGAVAVVLTLMVPLIANLASDDGLDDTIASEASPESATAADPTTGALVTPTLTPTSDDVSADTAAAPATYLDPADLPPAVPVNDLDAEPDVAAASADTEVAARGTDGSPDSTTGADATADIDSSADVDDQADRLRVPCPIDFTVRPGDFWIGLADDAGVELSALLDINRATADTPLYPGAEICLPSGATVPTATATTTATNSGTGDDSNTATTTAPTTPVTSPPTTTAPATTAPTTTTAPATTAPTTTSTTDAPVAPAGPEEVTSIIRDVWPDDLEERALEIAYRESRYVPTAKNFCCYGLFQIYWTVHQSWLADLGITSAEQLYDPETNARAAYALYQRAGGWGPWAF